MAERDYINAPRQGQYGFRPPTLPALACRGIADLGAVLELLYSIRRFARPKDRPLSFLRCLLVLAVCLLGWAEGVERLTVRRDGLEQSLEGRTVVKADDGLLFETRDGAYWIVPTEQIAELKDDDVPFKLQTGDEIAAALKSQYPGFEIYQTKHYVLCFNTSRAYAQWCGSLFERLYQAFQNYWSNRGFELREPEAPLVALVFADRVSYARAAQPELGDGVNSIIGYYSLKTNRMTMYDMTGTAGTVNDRRTAAQIALTLTKPDAAKTVATIVHEATHQIAFNCGFHRRYADIPLWVSEGVAIYFEAPDLKSSKGWSTIGQVHHARLAAFRAYQPRRPADSLETLLRDDARMRNAQTAGAAYAEAWALNYFLIATRSKEYRDYLQALAAKGPLVTVSSETRLAEFRNAFGDDLAALDREFLRYVSRLK